MKKEEQEKILEEFEKIPRVKHAPDFENENDNESCLSVPTMREFLKRYYEKRRNTK